MIVSAEEFSQLCASTNSEDLERTISDAASLEVWQRIIQEYPSLCSDVAQNRTLPEEVLFLLAKNSNGTTRYLIAERGRLPIPLFEVLANDDDERVRRAIAAHRKTPIEILAKLSKDVIESVASVALFNLSKRPPPE